MRFYNPQVWLSLLKSHTENWNWDRFSQTPPPNRPPFGKSLICHSTCRCMRYHKRPQCVRYKKSRNIHSTQRSNIKKFAACVTIWPKPLTDLNGKLSAFNYCVLSAGCYMNQAWNSSVPYHTEGVLRGPLCVEINDNVSNVWYTSGLN